MTLLSPPLFLNPKFRKTGTKMALLSPPLFLNPKFFSPKFQNPSFRTHSSLTLFRIYRRNGHRIQSIVTCQLCTDQTLTLDRSNLSLGEAFTEDELWAAACLRVRSFYACKKEESFGIQDHKKYLAEREFEALKERIAGKRVGFKRVSCINATVPLSQMSSFSEDLCSLCKYSDNGEDRVVIGTLDLNQCLRLPDEITGKRPEGIGSDFARAYLSNVCVAKELLRNGVASSLILKSKDVAHEWGITDLYVHVAFDNEPARKLYIKSGFVHENDEPTWQARFLDRPRRILLWTDVSDIRNL